EFRRVLFRSIIGTDDPADLEERAAQGLEVRRIIKATFYIGTDDPADLEALRRAFLAADSPLPISGEYMSSHAFDLAIEYGKDTYVSLKHVGSRVLVRMFALKSWANGVFAKLPGMGPSV